MGWAEPRASPGLHLGLSGHNFQPSGRQLSKGKDFGSSSAKSQNLASGEG